MRTIAFLLIAAALAGCIDPDDRLGEDLPPANGGSSPGPGFAPQEGFGEDTQGDLHLVVLFDTCDAGFCLNATATNEGSSPYHISSICVPPHEERMERDGKTVYPREPMAYCAAFGLREMAPGEDVHFAYEWDGMLWDDESGKRVPAPQGAYQWSALFHAFEDGEGGERVTLEVTHTVVIGET